MEIDKDLSPYITPNEHGDGLTFNISKYATDKNIPEEIATIMLKNIVDTTNREYRKYYPNRDLFVLP
jgi:hypothetical protein